MFHSRAFFFTVDRIYPKLFVPHTKKRRKIVLKGSRASRFFIKLKINESTLDRVPVNCSLVSDRQSMVLGGNIICQGSTKSVILKGLVLSEYGSCFCRSVVYL